MKALDKWVYIQVKWLISYFYKIMGKVTEKFAIISESRWDFLALPGLFGLIDPKNCYIWPYKTMVVSN